MVNFEQDFLMRQIQHLTQLLQQIIFKKKQNQKDEALEDIHHALQRLTKEHPKTFDKLNLEETVNVFVSNNKFESDLAIAVADLLYEQAKMLDETQYSLIAKSRQQALLLYKKVLLDENTPMPLDLHNRVENLTQSVPNDQLKPIEKIIRNYRQE